MNMIRVNVTNKTFTQIVRGYKKEFGFWKESPNIIYELETVEELDDIEIEVRTKYPAAERAIRFRTSFYQVNDIIYLVLEEPFFMWQRDNWGTYRSTDDVHLLSFEKKK